ncbi:type II toxin-antitoxin system VapC family toxin [Rhodoblastus acidophilus]|uniref:type II toxin-antitoxin system VapC family toxin n=1 Tax=Rhodoblastus acidophilus TaxID=1074 RepID=UPI000CEC2D98|nr:type II toxin-antitoxin system VapC family toxin [Rhodoblastus acidophilus]PPQ35254.1 VapC toxin family PIN domain ribonuclease [Rhodoblastus acidophilus]RAI16354.1 VapC toxin family PIN domain ribonuclease [Rhodoblastus acidophilus]
MFVDACAIIAVLSDEPEADRISKALGSADNPFTSPVAVLEAALGLARADKFARPVADVEPIVMEFLDDRGIEIRDLPPAVEATRLVLSAAHRYRSGRHGLNLGDCFHYACAKYFDVPILATANEFAQTDVRTAS